MREHDAIPGGNCLSLGGTALRDCLERTARCNICFTLNASDNLTINYDLYDDGNSNESCFVIF